MRPMPAQRPAPPHLKILSTSEGYVTSPRLSRSASGGGAMAFWPRYTGLAAISLAAILCFAGPHQVRAQAACPAGSDGPGDNATCTVSENSEDLSSGITFLPAAHTLIIQQGVEIDNSTDDGNSRRSGVFAPADGQTVENDGTVRTDHNGIDAFGNGATVFNSEEIEAGRVGIQTLGADVRSPILAKCRQPGLREFSRLVLVRQLRTPGQSTVGRG